MALKIGWVELEYTVWRGKIEILILVSPSLALNVAHSCAVVNGFYCCLNHLFAATEDKLPTFNYPFRL
ncbi:hypothetical protein Fmac_020640 [Flemingia macrophylla]|uniref:Uncharacterized protein n=1 Tax=Flemingia macrophylla TaxID=520843 RepID=A0ABD1LV54_9FABA